LLLDLLDLNVLRYITFRAALAALVAFALGVAAGPAVIRALRRRKIGETGEKGDSARLDALHHGKKGTPTMGGVLIVGSALAATLLFARLGTFFVQAIVLSMVALGAIGLVDDRAKLTSRGRGLSARRKLLLQVLIGLAVGIAMQVHYDGLERRADAYAPSPDEAVDTANIDLAGPALGGAPGLAPVPPLPAEARARPANLVEGTAVYVPFFKRVRVPLGAAFVLFAALVVAATVNAVNFTDGLDGLAAGTSCFALGVFTVIAYLVGRSDFSRYLQLPFVPGAGEAAVVGAATLGATLAFLWFNAYPAEVFMGDTGSLALGGTIAVLALGVKQELLLFVAGFVFALEGISVVLQIACFKLTGRRIFRIAPIHHHFQFGGLFETKVTTRLWIVAAILAVAALATLKVR
jgi:phospho-N-acetylmuramoyl-pentapeptide-transferase